METVIVKADKEDETMSPKRNLCIQPKEKPKVNAIRAHSYVCERFYDLLVSARISSAFGKSGNIQVPVAGSLFYVESVDEKGDIYHHFEPETGEEDTMSSELEKLVIEKLRKENLRYLGAQKVASIRYSLDAGFGS